MVYVLLRHFKINLHLVRVSHQLALQVDLIVDYDFIRLDLPF